MENIFFLDLDSSWSQWTAPVLCSIGIKYSNIETTWVNNDSILIFGWNILSGYISLTLNAYCLKAISGWVRTILCPRNVLNILPKHIQPLPWTWPCAGSLREVKSLGCTHPGQQKQREKIWNRKFGKVKQ